MASFSIFKATLKNFKEKLTKVLNTFENIMENGAFAYNIFKYMIFQRRQKALLWSEGLLNS